MIYLGIICWDAQYIRLFELIHNSEIFQKMSNNLKLSLDYLYISPICKGSNKFTPPGIAARQSGGRRRRALKQKPLQFIATYNRVKDVENDDLFWGDEVEYGVFELYIRLL